MFIFISYTNTLKIYIYGKCRCQSNFAVVFRVNDGKYQAKHFADTDFC